MTPNIKTKANDKTRCAPPPPPPTNPTPRTNVIKAGLYFSNELLPFNTRRYMYVHMHFCTVWKCNMHLHVAAN